MTEKTKSENFEQMHVVSWFRKTHKGVLIFYIRNGGKVSPSQGALNKALGLIPGVPDLFIPAWNLWIEMKAEKGGVTSPVQKEMHTYLRGVGHTVFIAKGSNDAIVQINLHFSNK